MVKRHRAGAETGGAAPPGSELRHNVDGVAIFLTVSAVLWRGASPTPGGGEFSPAHVSFAESDHPTWEKSGISPPFEQMAIFDCVRSFLKLMHFPDFGAKIGSRLT